MPQLAPAARALTDRHGYFDGRFTTRPCIGWGLPERKGALSRSAARPLGIRFRLSLSTPRPSPRRLQFSAQLLVLSAQTVVILLGLLQTLAQNSVFLFQFFDSLEGCAGVCACHSKLRYPKIAKKSSEKCLVAANQLPPGLKFGQPRVMALLLALTMFQHLIHGFRNRDLRQQVADLLGVTLAEYTPHQMIYDLRRLRLKGLIYRPPKTNRYFVTPYGWKVARLFSRLEARVFRPAMAMFTANDAVLPFPLRQALDRVDTQLDLLIYDAFPLPKAS
jgi:hypothetical protein